jgi:M6 family metalloprotease-like protein
VKITRLIAVVALASTFVVGGSFFGASAAVKVGAICKKAGQTSSTGGAKYICSKSGKKLAWKQIPTQKPVSSLPIVSPSAEPIPVSSATASSASSSTGKETKTDITPKSQLSDVALFSNLDKCRIVDGDPQTTNMSAGFPIPQGRIDLVRGAKIQIIGVDFKDKPGGEKSPRELHERLTRDVEDFWRAQSSVPVQFDWNWKKEWVSMPKSINEYSLGGSFFEGKFNPEAYFGFARDIIGKTDSEVDFSGVNFLFIVFPAGIKNSEIGTFLVHTQGAYSTNENQIFNLIMAGGDYANSDTYIHEFGHGLGLTDIRDTLDLANQKSDGMFYDVMNNPTYPELLVWHRFLLGFLENSQLHCISSPGKSIHWIAPVASQGKDIKGIVIPLSGTEAIVVESRRAIGFDKALNSRPDLVGAVVYKLDTKIPYRRTPVRVVNVLQNEESIITDGYRISVVESGAFGDVVKVEKL